MIAPRNYSMIAPVYDKIFSLPLGQGHRLISELFKKYPHYKFLEVGVGSGLIIDRIEDHDFTGIDINEDMLYLAQIKALGRHNIKLHKMDAEKLDFKKNQFDIVMAPSVLSAVEHPDRVLEEMIRVTKPGGKIVIIAHFDDKKRVINRILDPVTRSLLGFRLDLDFNLFSQYRELKLLRKKRINQIGNYHLSWYLEFEKQY